MQTRLTEDIGSTALGQEAESILRSCVHCGFCNATCPTYQLLGDELDGPRGRIYLIKQVLEGNEPSRHSQLHLDRCLTCRNCETTCPSGVRYGRLLDIGRALVQEKVTRSPLDNLMRWVLRRFIPYPRRFGMLLNIARLLRPLLPRMLRDQLPKNGRGNRNWPQTKHARRMLALDGCVQSNVAPEINAAAARVLDRSGITLSRVAKAGCCGAIDHHLGHHEVAKDFFRRNIDAWWPHIEQGAGGLLVTASGCLAVIRDYGELLSDDPEYRDKAARISELAKDPGELLADEALPATTKRAQRVAFHSPCSLQHALKIRGVVEPLLERCGYELVTTPDPHLCCGSAGTYSILEPELSAQLRDNKLETLQSDRPDLIATANIGCLNHLRSGAAVPVRHWIELVDEATRS